jgi:hypothetical protein
VLVYDPEKVDELGEAIVEFYLFTKTYLKALQRIHAIVSTFYYFE